MKELWEQATQFYNLPLTVGLIIFCSYWIISSIGIFDFDTEVDLDIDTDTDIDLNPGAFSSIMNFVNAADVPLMLVLTILNIFTWTISMISNEMWNPQHSLAIAGMMFAGNLILSILITRIVTKPLAPLFKALKTDSEAAEPLIGQEGKVKSRVLDHHYGQVIVKRHNTAPALLNCKLSESDKPMVRGEEVLIVSYDKPSKKYIVKSLQSNGTITLDNSLSDHKSTSETLTENLTTSE